jgi:hypothetical protein
MRKLTALTVALSLSAAGQAFAGPPHAPAAHAKAVDANAAAEIKDASTSASLSHSLASRGRAQRYRQGN